MTRHRTAPSVRGVALTDLSAVGGAILWVGLTVGVGLGPIERALALAPLVLVPLGIGFVATPSFDGLAGRLYAAAVVCQPVGAALFAGSLVVDSATLATAMASAWLVVAILLALVATVRTADRGPWPLAETVVDAGLAYTVVGAAALILYHLGVTLWFSPVIVLLTAVHFHYAGFVLPVTTGLIGRCAAADADGALYRPLAGVVAVGPAIIAVGISFSPVVELLAVAFSLPRSRCSAGTSSSGSLRPVGGRKQFCLQRRRWRFPSRCSWRLPTESRRSPDVGSRG